jgi:shikimate dehydrogenase
MKDRMPETFSFGLVGYPVEHSYSPRMHMAAMQQLGLSGEYLLYPLERPSGLADILEQMRLGKIHGLNVTIPYKNEILPLLDDLTPAAKAVGAANTVFRRKGQLVGDNTDATGFLADLERIGWLNTGYPDRSALILGAGGSARAVVYALFTSGWQVAIAARRWEQAAALVKMMQGSADVELDINNQDQLTALGLDKNSISELDPKAFLIINTTPLGMLSQENISPWPAGLDFPARARIYDLVYNPSESILISTARKRGHQAVNGIGMLVEQAALSLEIWTGLTAPRQAMHQAVMEYSKGV